MHKKLGIIFLFTLIFFVQLLFPLSVQVAEPFDTADVDEFVTNYLDRNGLPGASIVIVKEGKNTVQKRLWL